MPRAAKKTGTKKVSKVKEGENGSPEHPTVELADDIEAELAGVEQKMLAEDDPRPAISGIVNMLEEVTYLQHQSSAIIFDLVNAVLRFEQWVKHRHGENSIDGFRPWDSQKVPTNEHYRASMDRLASLARELHEKRLRREAAAAVQPSSTV